MDQIGLLEKAGERTGKLVEQVSADQRTATTPCTDWDVNALLNHLIGGNMMFGTLISGGTLPDMSGGMPDLAGDDPATAYRTSFAQSLDAWRAPGALDGTVALPYGEVPRGFAIGLHLMDTVVHGWDLARATGQDTDIDEDLAQAVHAVVSGMFANGRMEGPFGPEVAVPDSAPTGHRVLGLLGRTP